MDGAIMTYDINNNNTTMHMDNTSMSSDSIDGKKVKRPMNAFMLWSKEKRREISKRDPSLHNAQISKLLGEQWKILSAEEKLPFIDKSQKLMIRHKKEHPDYRYKPRQSKLTKNMKGFAVYPQQFYMQSSKRMNLEVSPTYQNGSRDHHVFSYEAFPYRSSYSQNKPRYWPSDVCSIPGCYECSVSERYHQYEKSFMHNAPNNSALCPCCPPNPKTLFYGETFKKGSNFSVDYIIQSSANKKFGAERSEIRVRSADSL